MTTETEAALKNLHQMFAESDASVKPGMEAMDRLARACMRSACSRQAYVMRRLLFSLYRAGGYKVDLSDVMVLDWNLRKDLCAVILSINIGAFSDSKIREAFKAAGDVDAQWFLEEADSE